MLVKRLELENFQSHYKSSIDFDDHFTCIVGPTNSGKSAVVRAFTFLLYGDWTDDFISHGEKITRITLTLDDGTSLLRVKGPKDNTIILTRNKKTYTFEKVGKTVPTEFYKLLDLSPVQLDFDKEIYLNIADQDDPYFLLKETGPTKTKLLGKLAGLHLADAALGGLSTDKKRLSTEKTHRTKETAKLEEQLTTYKDLTTHQELVASSVVLLQRAATLVDKVAAFNLLHDKLTAWKTASGRLRQLKARLQLPDLKAAEQLQVRLDRLKTAATRFQELKQLHTSLQVKSAEYANNVRDLKEEYASVLSTAKTCPTCFSDINSEKVRARV